MTSLKNIIRKILWALHLDVTLNLMYDRATQRIMRQVLKPGSNCIDVGAHKGELLEQMFKYAPGGTHLAVEPIPELAQQLKTKFASASCRVEQCALSNYEGETTFNLVKNAPAYSGLRQRKYAVGNPEIEKIKVKVCTLDSIWDNNLKPDFIKLDIEGGELHALEGARNILTKFRPYVIFEFGQGSAEFYESTPEKMYRFFESIDMCIQTLDQWYPGSTGLSKAGLVNHFRNNSAYYFIAFPCST